MNLPPAFFNSVELRNTSKDAIVIYLILKADMLSNGHEIIKKAKLDQKLVSVMTVQSIAQVSGLSEITVARLIDELIKRKWIAKDTYCEKGVFCIGEIVSFEMVFFLDNVLKTPSTEEPKLTPVEIIRRKIEEERKLLESKKLDEAKDKKFGLSEKTKAKIAASVTESYKEDTVKAKDIIKTFGIKYEKKYGKPAPFISDGPKGNPHATTYVYVGRAIEWSKSAKEVLEVVEFMFEKWDEIKLGLNLDGPPSFNLLGSSKIWPRLVACKTEGIPKPKPSAVVKSTVTHRFKEDETGKETGW